MAQWRRLARTDEIEPGAARAFEIQGRMIAVFNLGGEFHAIDNTCPHRGGSLAHGRIEGETVTCPMHAWTFNIKTGELPMGGGVAVHPVKIEGGSIYVEA